MVETTGGPMGLLVQLGMEDMDRMARGGPVRPYGFEGFVWEHHGLYEDQVDQLQANGCVCYRYFNMLHYPPPESVERFARWQVEVMLQDWRAYRAKPAGPPGYYREDGRCMLIGWDQLHARPNWHGALIERLHNLARGGRVFLGQFHRWDYPWMYHQKGAQFGDFSPQDHLRWWMATNRLLWYLATSGQPSPHYLDLLVSGDTSIGHPGALNHPPVNSDLDPVPDSVVIPVVVSHAEADWEAALKLWALNPEYSVLSVDASHSADVAQALAHWREAGGWLHFSGPYMEVDMAYRAAAEQRDDAAKAVRVQPQEASSSPQPPAPAPAPNPPAIKPVRRQLPRLQKLEPEP